MIYAPARFPRRHGYESPLAQRLAEKSITAGARRDVKEFNRLQDEARRAERDFLDAVHSRLRFN